jgi:hypothetical protein
MGEVASQHKEWFEAGGVDGKGLPSMYKALGPIPSTGKKYEKKKPGRVCW